MVKLTANHSHTFVNSDGNVNPVVFTPISLGGFGDYAAAYSHFRVLKASYVIPRDTRVDTANAIIPEYSVRYLIAGSRPFAANQAPIGQGVYNPLLYVPPTPPTALRQSRWQKTFFPNTTRPGVTTNFYPYTMVGTFGPASGAGYQYQRTWEGRRWMPFTWARGQAPSYLAFFGPYIYPYLSIDSTEDTASQVVGTLTVWLQFKGQV